MRLPTSFGPSLSSSSLSSPSPPTVPPPTGPGYNAPQQVHITQGDHLGKAVIVSWVTMKEPGSDTVVYWSEDNNSKNTANGIVTTYTYFDYTSGFIHRCHINSSF
ncbi:hypothetical protein LXL04_016452 [Taraxacum kok-saghyz]